MSLHLCSGSLLSKWGFEDGDEPEAWLDWVEEHHPDIGDYDWREVLATLVRLYLLPEIEKHHTITLVDVNTIHNPIRASIVDGVDVEDEWYGSAGVSLRPKSVTVPFENVLAVIRER